MNEQQYGYQHIGEENGFAVIELTSTIEEQQPEREASPMIQVREEAEFADFTL